MPPDDDDDSRRPLIVRLRNWVGDATLGVPMLQRLSDAGYALQLVGKRWAGDLLAGHGWPVHPLPGSMRDRVALLRSLCRQAVAAEPRFERDPVNALCLPYSFSSALDFRLSGLHALGHAHEGRSLLLAKARRMPQDVHELRVYWDLGDALLGHAAPVPERIGLRIAPAHAEQAAALRRRHGIESDCVVVCPFAGGTYDKRDKTWPAFADFVARELPAIAGRGRSIVVCPAPGDEETLAREHYPGARLLAGVGMGAYAALLRDSALMLANDTGPGHVAAAVGTPLVSVLGPTDPARWGAWGPNVRHVQGPDSTWPDARAVADAVANALAEHAAPAG